VTNRVIVLLLVLGCVGRVDAQLELDPLHLVEAPTAGLLPRGSFGLDFRFYGGNGILGQIDVGLFDRGMIGISYGARDLLGNAAVKWNPRLEFAAKIRVVEEGYSSPALAVGYASQGYGAFDQTLERYQSKSKGAYVVVSKNFNSPFGQGGVHLGMNKSFEDGDGDGDLSGFIGVDKAIGKDFLVVAEYDFGLNDNSDNALGSGKGFLNAGARWMVSKNFAVEFDLKNIFRNGTQNPQPDREIRIVYFEKF
jgi:hypothetical protein